MRATGTFEVKLNTVDAYEPSIGRRTIDKHFHGDLEATSKGEMLAAMGGVQGSGAYVAFERVTGSFEGKRGSFALYHASTMTRGVAVQSVRVVPDSGTDALTGLSGEMTIIVEGGKHSYVFEYEIAAG
jgi:hypothetical protein